MILKASSSEAPPRPEEDPSTLYAQHPNSGCLPYSGGDRFWESCCDWELKCSSKIWRWWLQTPKSIWINSPDLPSPRHSWVESQDVKSGSTFTPILCKHKPCRHKGELSLISDVTEQTWRSFSVSLCSPGALYSFNFLPQRRKLYFPSSIITFLTAHLYLLLSSL